MPQHEEEEDAGSGEPDVRRSQLGALRDEVAKLEKTVNDVNVRIRSLVDGRITEPVKGDAQPTPLDPAPIPSVTQRIKATRIRLENDAIERLRRIGTE